MKGYYQPKGTFGFCEPPVRRKNLLQITVWDTMTGDEQRASRQKSGQTGSGSASSLAFGPVGTTISNLTSKLINKNPKWKSGFSGEKHAVLPTKYGLTRANYAGPGTKLERRLTRGDQGVDGPDGIDAAAKVHDISYANAKTMDDVRNADLKMIRDVQNSSAGDRIKTMVIGIMTAKMKGEDLGVIDVNTFTDVIPKDQLRRRPGMDMLRNALQSLIIPKLGRGRESSWEPDSEDHHGDGIFTLMASIVAPLVIEAIINAAKK